MLIDAVGMETLENPGKRHPTSIIYPTNLSKDHKSNALAEISSIFSKYWKRGYGSITAQEAFFLQNLIHAYRPSNLLEIGMASGLSCGLMANFLDLSGGGHIVTIDHDNTFFGDNSKSNGFLIDQIYTGSKVKINKAPFHTALDLDKFNSVFDLVFIDANHQHPWPTLDTLLANPWLAGSKIVVHHDYKLYIHQTKPIGIGPKYLYDQFPDHLKLRSPEDDGNIFALSLAIDHQDLEEIAISSLMLPWSLQTPLTARGESSLASRIVRTLSKYYSTRLVDAFKTALAKFGRSDEGIDE